MDSIIDFLDAYRAIIGAVVVTLLATVIIIKWWDEVKLFWKSVGYGLPLIGKVSRLSKDTARDSSGWFQSEKALCHSFYSDIKKIAADPQMFDRATSYLGKVQERGRNELSLFMWVVIVALVSWKPSVLPMCCRVIHCRVPAKKCRCRAPSASHF